MAEGMLHVAAAQCRCEVCYKPSLAKRLEAEPSNIIRGDSAEPARSASTARNPSTAPETSSAADTAQRPAAVPKLDLTASASTRMALCEQVGFDLSIGLSHVIHSYE